MPHPPSTTREQATLERVIGAAIEGVIDELAQLRMAVFREYPYLYEGSREYEAHYLRSYATARDATLVLARAEGRIVGAATAMPLTEHSEDVAPALRRGGFEPRSVYYFGESVLLPAYRGRGLGHAFFDHREARARDLGFRVAAFCAVERPCAHPARPSGYVPHDAFWIKRGYAKHPDMTTSFSWRDMGDHAETAKTMVFWTRNLERSASGS